MDIKYLFYTFLCIIAFILVICFGNSKSILKKEANIIQIDNSIPKEFSTESEKYFSSG